MDDLLIDKAVPDDAGEIAAFYQGRYDVTYLFGQHDVGYGDPAWVRAVLESGRDVVYVARSNGAIVGSTVAVVAGWNNSAQLCRTAVHEAVAGKGVAKGLCERVRDEAIARGVDILWGSLRNPKMVSISRQDGLSTVGYLDGVYLGAEHETHLMAVRLLSGAHSSRVVSPVGVIYELDGVQEILSRMELGLFPAGQYPGLTVVNPELVANVASGEVEGFYDLRNRSLIVTKYEGGLVRDLHRLEGLAEHGVGGPIDYSQMTVIADKVRVMKEARDLGYRMTAVLPGWYAEGLLGGDQKRYDCVLLSKSGPSVTDPSFAEQIKRFEKGFAQFPSGAYLRSLIQRSESGRQEKPK